MPGDEQGILTGRAAWIASLRSALVSLSAEAASPRELQLWSADFAEWPLDEPAVIEALTLWLRPAGRRLTLIARDFETTARRHPRLARWRRDWSHRIDAWSPTVPLEAEPAGLLLLGTQVVQLLDAVHWRSTQGRDAQLARTWRERIDAALQRCEAAWPATTLGL